MSHNFANTAPCDFSLKEVRERFQDALNSVEKFIADGKLVAKPAYPGVSFKHQTSQESLDPSNPDIKLGTVYFANRSEAEEVLIKIKSHQKFWNDFPVASRTEVLKKAADIMLTRRFELAALVVREAGKPWKEADADIAEGIDFCNYYAQEMEKLGQPVLTQNVPGETNKYFYQARGLAVIIAPWNFPFAIACGMFVAALVTGNVAILKPAEQTSLIAAELFKILLEAGFPPEVLAFLPGLGEEVGAHMVESTSTNLICFTGSKQVGLEILKNTSSLADGQKHFKKVILELGGKNAIIIDNDADLDEAIKGVLYSSFGFTGQKCSACSRVIVVGDAYEVFLERLSEATSDLIIGATSNPATYVGPVIDREARDRINNTIKKGKESLTLLFQGETPQHGYFVAPTIFRDVPETSELWTNEIFGPVICCRKADSFEEAITLATNSQYALTGGVYSRSPKNIDLAIRDFLVGNLYINRGCTGAIVERQPFGGFCLSGIGSKAGGPDYLIQFMEPRTVSENTMRRGFTPESV